MQITTTRHTVLALAAIVGLALGGAACGDDDDDTASSDGYAGDGGAGATLEITGLQYADASAAAGGSLEIVNSSGAPHTFTSDDGSFDPVDVAADGRATAQVPAQAGEYPFHCEIHPSMQATLTVE